MTKRRKIKPVSKSVSGKGIAGIGSGNLTSAEQIKNQFFSHASCQRAGKESGDANYWTDGRCNWGGSHNLKEDCQKLADFANGVANISDEKQELTLAVNEEEFNSKKQQLISKLQDYVGKCQTSDTHSIANVCCIWNDFFGSFLRPWLDGLRQKFQTDLQQLQTIEPKHQKEILELETKIKEAENKYSENMANATKETDPAKKVQFIATAQSAEREVRIIKKQLDRNPLSKYIEHSSLMNYARDIENLMRGNLSSASIPTKPAKELKNVSQGNSQTSWTSWSGNTNNQSTNQQSLVIIAIITLIISLYLYYSQSDQEDLNYHF